MRHNLVWYNNSRL